MAKSTCNSSRNASSAVCFALAVCLLLLFADHGSFLEHGHVGMPLETAGFMSAARAAFGSIPTGDGKDDGAVPDGYPTFEEIQERLSHLVNSFPHLAAMYKIGESAAGRLPIWAIRLSDNPGIDEDEPAVLFNGVHHAREPVGAFICTNLMERILRNYERDQRYRRLVDSLEIWLVPMVNPDGYKYIIDNGIRYPWWRKNLRDNNNDGFFNPLIDGVDLNRNYGFNWGDGDEGAPGSWFYHGRAAFSEPEVQSLRDLACQENVLLGIDYHSYGESVLFPWGNFHSAPDQLLIYDIAVNCAMRIGRESGYGTYNVLPLNGRVGQSSVWMYGDLGAVHFIVESGSSYFPPMERVPKIVRENLRGVEFLLSRALRSGITGHVRDAASGKPVVAEIHVEGLQVPFVRPRRSDEIFGRFDRLLLPGSYTVTILAPGYQPVTISGVSVHEDRRFVLEVALQRRPAVLPTGTN